MNFASVSAIVLAGGKGTRMGTRVPKVLRKIEGTYLVQYILSTLDSLKLAEIIVVLGHRAAYIQEKLGTSYNYAVQEQPMGTGHALQVGVSQLKQKTHTIIVINGDDSSLLKATTIQEILKQHERSAKKVTIVTSIQEKMKNLYKVEKDGEGNFLGFEKDESDQKKEIATGIYVFDRIWLQTYIHLLEVAASGEINIHHLLHFAKLDGGIHCFQLLDSDEWRSSNTPSELASVRRMMKKKSRRTEY